MTRIIDIIRGLDSIAACQALNCICEMCEGRRVRINGELKYRDFFLIYWNFPSSLDYSRLRSLRSIIAIRISRVTFSKVNFASGYSPNTSLSKPNFISPCMITKSFVTASYSRRRYVSFDSKPAKARWYNDVDVNVDISANAMDAKEREVVFQFLRYI